MTLKPCHHCGSDCLVYSARSPRMSRTPGRIITCRACKWTVSFDTPQRGSNTKETCDLRNRAAFARWNNATAADMRPIPGFNELRQIEKAEGR